MNIKKLALFSFGIFLLTFSGHAQRIAVKTNSLGWLTASPNIEAELVFNNHFSVNVGVMGNYLKTQSFKSSFTHFQPEVRYWFSRPMVRHFIGATAFINNFDFLVKNKIHKGDAWATGLTYGYAWAINSRWNIEATAGVGLLKYRQFKYGKEETKPNEINDKRTLLAPIKLGLSIAYIIK